MNKKHQIEVARHGQPLPRIHSVYSIVLRASAIVLALTVIAHPFVLAQFGADSGVSAILIAVEMMSLLCLVIAVLFRRGEKRTIPMILTDHRTVHWTYSPEEWQRFTTQAWQRSLPVIQLLTAIFGALLVLSIVFYFVNTQGALDGLEFLAIFLCGIVGVVLLLMFLNATLSWWSRRRRTSSDVYIHRKGIILDGWYSPMGGIFSGLNKITYKAGDPDVLHFFVGSGRGRRILEVPVPHGCEIEAEYLARSLPYSTV